jgi:hypothetical protein
LDVKGKDDPFMDLLMSGVEVSDALAFINRMGLLRGLPIAS